MVRSQAKSCHSKQTTKPTTHTTPHHTARIAHLGHHTTTVFVCTKIGLPSGTLYCQLKLFGRAGGSSVQQQVLVVCGVLDLSFWLSVHDSKFQKHRTCKHEKVISKVQATQNKDLALQLPAPAWPWLLLLASQQPGNERERAHECAGQEGEKDEGGDKGRARVCCNSPLKHCLFVD